MKRQYLYGGLLFLSFGLLIVMEVSKPKPIDWSMNFTKNSKIPYGNFILHDLLPELLPNKKVQTVEETAYLLLKKEEFVDNSDSNHTTLLIINNQFSPDKEETTKLLNYVAKGNHLFISAMSLKGTLADTLHLSTTPFINYKEDTLSFSLINPAFSGIKSFRGKTSFNFINSFDTLQSIVLGKAKIEQQQQINFIKTKFGKGSIFFHSNPLAFTNINTLKRDNLPYIKGTLSYLPKGTLLWDEYYKAGRLQITTPLRYFLSQPPLKWAYFVGVFSLLVFILFEVKRKQRIIPIINPLKNSSLDFAKTIGQLYLESGSHKAMADKKILYFKEYLRTHFYLSTEKSDESFFKKLSEKTGVSIENVNALFKIIQECELSPKINEAQLLKLNQSIEKFVRKSIK
ncbi:DUF4350 domain-containing protein [Xanthovirga aplysinae]|uniref:DUF4350 domain-containing protein n=1 Tax=Xanthovirga aplysinae TaxID=2529853 RepID=UPI0012BD7C74|nr:DUF4350 domain-containing protein [Xanthovirga aplysinae]MTI32845.1 DUF4350 domain-containing protein [Xanthovirga aplysinae]